VQGEVDALTVWGVMHHSLRSTGRDAADVVVVLEEVAAPEVEEEIVRRDLVGA